MPDPSYRAFLPVHSFRQDRGGNRLPDPVLVVGSDYSINPMPGQLSLSVTTRLPGEVNVYETTGIPRTVGDLLMSRTFEALPAHGPYPLPEPTTACKRWGHWYNPSTDRCNRCGDEK